MATGAAARVQQEIDASRAARGALKGPKPWWQRIAGWVSGLWVKTPATFHTDLIRRVSGLVEYGVIGAIIAQTEATHSKHEWAAITEKQFSELIGCTEEAVHKALDEVERCNFIESRPAGRGKEYRALPKNFDQGPERARRKPPEADESPRHVDRKFPLSFQRGRTISLPQQVKRVRWNAEGTVRGAIDGDLLDLTSPEPAAKPELQFRNEKAKTRKESLREWLAPFFVNRWGKTLDEEFLSRIHARLGVAGVEQYSALILDAATRFDKSHKPRDFKSGLLLDLADQARQAAAEWAKQNGKLQSIGKPEDRVRDLEVPFTPAAQDFDSPWAQIKLRLQNKMSQQAYANWVADSAFSSITAGELRVRVANEVCGDYLREEYAGDIAAAIRDLRLPVKSVVYLPATEIVSE